MGRTFRNRRRKGDPSINLSSDPAFVNLNLWMKNGGWEQSCPLRLAKFADTGRGLMARNNIKEGDVIISIPKSLLITTATVSNSTLGKVFSASMTKQNRFFCQELLASFLLWERHLGNCSSWGDYIATLPNSFSTPHVLDKYHLLSFPWFLEEKAVHSLELIQNCYVRILSLVQNYNCGHCKLSAAELFTWDSFLWGWCCVNTRAVFLEPEHVPSHSLLIRDRNCLALAPYLDMFNHSDSAKVIVGLNNTNNCYEIRTLQPFNKFEEVFINYGPHSNSKLFLEYGFILPSTVHDTIPIKFDNLVQACKAAVSKVLFEHEKVNFFQKHGLLTQLYISNNGLSWNSLTLLKVLLSSFCNAKTWEQISFMGNDMSLVNDSHLENAINCVIKLVKADMRLCQNIAFEKCDKQCCMAMSDTICNPSLDIYYALIQSFMSILKGAESSICISSLL